MWLRWTFLVEALSVYFFITMAGKLYYKKKSNSGKIPSQKSNAKARTSTVNKLRYFRAIFD